MAFFGITALGPQSSYLASRPEAFDVTLFDLEEFQDAFDQIDVNKKGSLPIEKVEAAMKLVFRGEIPGTEQGRVLTTFNALENPASISREEFTHTIQYLQETGGKPIDTSVSAHYKSFAILHAHRLRQLRPESGPEDIYTKPLTMLTEVGWRGKETPLGYVRCPKKQCEETKFLGELLKAGVI